MAARVGLEPTTNRLTADRSTTELPSNWIHRKTLACLVNLLLGKISGFSFFFNGRKVACLAAAKIEEGNAIRI